MFLCCLVLHVAFDIVGWFDIGMETPKLKRATESDKITLYFDKEVKRLYDVGKENGWNVSEVVRQAARQALIDRRDILEQKANHAG